VQANVETISAYTDRDRALKLKLNIWSRKARERNFGNLSKTHLSTVEADLICDRVTLLAEQANIFPVSKYQNTTG
jgi:hypothetical protein